MGFPYRSNHARSQCQTVKLITNLGKLKLSVPDGVKLISVLVMPLSRTMTISCWANIYYFAGRRHENMPDCTGSRVNTPTLSQCTPAGPVYTGMPLECDWLIQCTMGYHLVTQRIFVGYTGTLLEKLPHDGKPLEKLWPFQPTPKLEPLDGLKQPPTPHTHPPPHPHPHPQPQPQTPTPPSYLFCGFHWVQLSPECVF